MKAVLKVGAILLLASSLLAQTAPTAKKTARKPVASASASDVQALKDAVAAQQQQLQALQQQLQQTNQQLQQTSQQFQQTRQQLQQAQQAAADAQQKAASLESSVAQKDAVDKLNSQYADIQTTLTNNALSTQDEQKRVSALESTLGRFRWTGDVRVRGESFFQNYSGCTSCADRNRPRIRVRFGFEGKLNDDFVAGVSLATGTLQDPTSTNTTLTNFFEKKTIGLDRGYIIYNPVAHKWLSLTGGKFAYTWQRTSVTFDPDLNPEGFTERFSKDFTSVPVVKNVNLQFMQLFFNETSGTGGLFHGHDSFAVGGQVGGRLTPTKFWTLTPSFTILNWRYPDAILNANAFAVGATTGGSVVTIGDNPPAPITFQVPGEGPGCQTPKSAQTSSKLNVPNCAFAPNTMTNSTYLDANNNLHFLSGFLYADLILNNQFKTPWSRLPINLLLEYENNLNASDHPFDYTVKGAVADPGAVTRKDLGKQSHAYLADISIGQQKNRGDIQLGYAFLRQEQDSVIASFGESDQRAPTNTLQHRIYALWRIRQNTTASFTWWHGHTLDPYLQNAALASGMKVSTTPGVGVLVPGSGQNEPWLNRLQIDLIYTF
ncbi:MAG: putative porin [Acidobacteriales bacterium]|nr:putative porin [Candidatus Koribacter versatilis]MBI3644916.1 putative porin [Terriglobales bacterium]